jgi:hypothetical protein
VVFNDNKTLKKLLLKKQNNVSKNAELYADFKTVKKVAKKFMRKKLLTKMEKCSFPLLLMFIKLFSL